MSLITIYYERDNRLYIQYIYPNKNLVGKNVWDYCMCSVFLQLKHTITTTISSEISMFSATKFLIASQVIVREITSVISSSVQIRSTHIICRGKYQFLVSL